MISEMVVANNQCTAIFKLLLVNLSEKNRFEIVQFFNATVTPITKAKMN